MTDPLLTLALAKIDYLLAANKAQTVCLEDALQFVRLVGEMGIPYSNLADELLGKISERLLELETPVTVEANNQ